jgi:predicted ribosome quality control (RQC) complex YloA/Tae2 family protein
MNLEEKPKSFETMSKVVDAFFAETVVKRDKHDLLAHRLEEQKATLKELKQAQITFKKEGDQLSQTQDFEGSGKAYDKVKKARKKEIGLKEAIAETEIALKKAQIVVKAPKKKEIVEKEWFEKFRWFKSSDGFLVIGGKDATTNEIVVKKHTEKGDVVFHAEIVGAPFCVVKAEGKKIPGKTLEEAAQFAASYSKAWQQGLGTVDVFWVEPEQLSKEKGLPKGAFMVHGKHNYYRNVVLSIGFGMDKKGVLIHGPVEMVKRMTKRFVEVGPGRVKAGELAKKIKNKMKYDGKAEDIQRFVPTGKGNLK